VNRIVVASLLALSCTLASAAQHPAASTIRTNQATQHHSHHHKQHGGKNRSGKHHRPARSAHWSFFRAIPETQEGPRPESGPFL